MRKSLRFRIKKGVFFPKKWLKAEVAGSDEQTADKA